MKTLVIHPKDETTDFLSEIYSDKKWTVISENPSKKLLKQLIKEHDRIMMLGHGSEDGLFGYNRMIIDSKWVYILREKYCVGIWCNANVFFEKYGLNGFYTGMIISEDMEANMYNVNCTADDLEISNITFACAIKNYIDDDNSINQIRKNYTSNLNEVIKFNRENIFIK